MDSVTRERRTPRRIFSILAGFGLVAAMLAAATPAQAAAGRLDATFSGDGYVLSTPPLNTYEFGYSVMVQPDGKIVAVGTRYDAVDSDTPLGAIVARYLDDGSPDPAFGGGDGFVVVPVGDTSGGSDGALLSDGRIVVVGQADVDPNRIDTDWAVALLSKDGTLDTTFDGDGIAAVHFGTNVDLASGVAVDAADRIVVVGRSWSGGAGFSSGFIVVRMNTAGLLDATFDGDGIRSIPFHEGAVATDVAVQSDGKIVVAGGTLSNRQFAVARLLSDGSLDASFSGDGKAATPDAASTFDAQGVAIQPNGRIVLVGGTNDFWAARFTAGGKLDPNFGGDGLVRTDVGSNDELANDVAIDASGRVVAVGIGGVGGRSITIVRYTSKGNLDTAFSRDGKQSNLHGFGEGAALDTTGRLLVTGTDGSGRMITARYLME